MNIEDKTQEILKIFKEKMSLLLMKYLMMFIVICCHMQRVTQLLTLPTTPKGLLRTS